MEQHSHTTELQKTASSPYYQIQKLHWIHGWILLGCFFFEIVRVKFLVESNLFSFFFRSPFTKTANLILSSNDKQKNALKPQGQNYLPMTKHHVQKNNIEVQHVMSSAPQASILSLALFSMATLGLVPFRQSSHRMCRPLIKILYPACWRRIAAVKTIVTPTASSRLAFCGFASCVTRPQY